MTRTLKHIVAYSSPKAARASRSGSFFTSHVLFRIITSPFSSVYLGHAGKEPPFGLPVRMKFKRAADILFGLRPYA